MGFEAGAAALGEWLGGMGAGEAAAATIGPVASGAEYAALAEGAASGIGPVASGVGYGAGLEAGGAGLASGGEAALGTELASGAASGVGPLASGAEYATLASPVDAAGAAPAVATVDAPPPTNVAPTPGGGLSGAPVGTDPALTPSTASELTTQLPIEPTSGPPGEMSPGTPTGNASIDAALKQLGAGAKDALGYAKGAAPFAALGMNYLQGNRIQSASQKMAGISQPMLDTSNQLLQQYNTGTLTAADQANISQWKQKQIAQAKQYYSKALGGTGDSTMLQSALQAIDQQAVQMMNQALQNELQNSLKTAGIAYPGQQAAITASVQENQALMTAQQNFMRALAGMNATPAATQPAAQ